MILPWDDPVPSAAACSWVQYSGQKNPFRDSTEQAAAFMVGSTAAKMAKHKHTWDIARTKSGSQKFGALETVNKASRKVSHHRTVLFYLSRSTVAHSP